MSLDPEVQAMLSASESLDGPAMHESSVADLRKMILDTLPDLPQVDVQKVQSRIIAGPNGDIPVRIYWPNQVGSGSSSEALPLHVFFHGGGWVVGNLETHDEICRELCAGANILVVSVDYRLAPEDPFPAGLEDCYAAVCWANDNALELGAGKGAISIGGDSAGANLAAAVAMMARDKKSPELAFQLLAYPVTDATMNTASYQAYAEGYILTRDLMDWFWSHYCSKDADRDDPLASVLKAEVLTDLPKTLVLTAQYDPLRDEGEAYAERLRSAGVEVEQHRLDGLIHGFLSQIGYIKATRAGLELALHALRQVHEGS